MKANNGKGNISSRDVWRTPSELFKTLNKQYIFGFDCCANTNNKLCDTFSNDFESIDIVSYTAWMNPPFSNAWKMFEHFFKTVDRGVAIYRCDNLETGLWQKVILPNCDWIFIPDKRISYEGFTGEGARFPSALIGLGLDVPKGLSGTVLKL